MKRLAFTMQMDCRGDSPTSDTIHWMMANLARHAAEQFGTCVDHPDLKDPPLRSAIIDADSIIVDVDER
jgi:hypothetical protein